MEKKFYHAVAIALEGDPALIRRIRKRCSRLFIGSHIWKTAYELLKAARTPGGDQRWAFAKPPPDPETAWHELETLGVRLIFADEPEFPPLLPEIHNPPLGLYVRGTIPPQNAIAMVGTRRATPEGKEIAHRFARAIADAGFVVVSGLALGIDAAAHEGSLESLGGDLAGKTKPVAPIAVLACGLNKIYPAANQRLGEKILARGGAIVSEYPPGQPPYGYRFLERNRIVSGIAKGVLVIEAPERSGSLATVNFALQQNRDVFVVPGPITHPNFFGSHALIRQGAELITRPGDILAAYGINVDEKAAKNKAELASENDAERLILKALREFGVAVEVDKLIEMTKLEPRIVNQTISFLVLRNVVKETEAGYSLSG